MKNNATGTLKISVIVSTYNRHQALDAVLSALSEQDYPDFEIIVADDGSDQTTASLIEHHEVRHRYALQHVWQADEGFRLSEIRNKATLRATGEYIVFLDGDCIPRPNFVSWHATLAEKERFVTGHKVPLSRAVTEEVLANQIRLHRYTFKDWIRMRLHGRVSRLLPFISLPNGPWRKGRTRSWKKVIGCNMAMWSQDLKAINGFEEGYRGWGFKDNDVAIRLINSGIYRKDGRYATGVIHLWHEDNDRSHAEHNRHHFQMVLESGAIRAKKGLEQRYSQ